jgi:GTP cyclohydrolase I
VAYLSNGHVLGLSKIHRIVRHFARRPQVQERLTIQIADYLMKVLNTEHVAVIVDAEHLCVSSRGIEDHTSSTITSSFKGKFLEESVKNEFLRYLTLS